jgi:arylsulfatase A-like enzyme
MRFRSFNGATVVEQLRPGGYETNLVGKWHIKPTPSECGFTKAPYWLAPGGSPYLNPKPLATERRAFDWETCYAVISELDAGIGRVADAVEKSGQWNNTLILLLGDNGYLCGSKGLNGKVYPWEESIRVPFIAAGGLVAKFGRSEAPVASVDVPATMLDVAGIRSGHKLSGTSLRPAWSGGKFARDAAFASWQDGRAKALSAGYAVEPYRAVRTASRKYILWESKKEALFDLAADPFEEKNLVTDAAQAADLKSMRERLRARMKETADPAAGWL